MSFHILVLVYSLTLIQPSFFSYFWLIFAFYCVISSVRNLHCHEQIQTILKLRMNYFCFNHFRRLSLPASFFLTYITLYHWRDIHTVWKGLITRILKVTVLFSLGWYLPSHLSFPWEVTAPARMLLKPATGQPVRDLSPLPSCLPLT